jgi:hypothetical protein
MPVAVLQLPRTRTAILAIGSLAATTARRPGQSRRRPSIFKPGNQWHTSWNAGHAPARILEIISEAERFSDCFDSIKIASRRDRARALVGCRHRDRVAGVAGCHTDQDRSVQDAHLHGMLTVMQCHIRPRSSLDRLLVMNVINARRAARSLSSSRHARTVLRRCPRKQNPTSCNQKAAPPTHRGPPGSQCPAPGALGGSPSDLAALAARLRQAAIRADA